MQRADERPMKTNKLIPTLVLVIAIAGHVTAQCKKQPVEDLAKAIAEGFESKTLHHLDKQQPYRGKIRIVIEHSLAGNDDKDRFVSRSFASLARAEAWLKRGEHEELPARSVKPFQNCARGVCTFNFDGGILHNNLYLKRITYGIRAGCPYLKTIYLLDGD